MKLRFSGVLMLVAAATAMAAVDPVLLSLAMPDSTILTGIQVDASLASPFGQYVLSQMQPGDPGFQKFILSTGFDPTRDLQQVLGATNGVAVMGTNGAAPTVASGALALGRGTFVPSQILAAATAQGGTITTYRGFSVISEPSTGNSTSSGAISGAIVFLDSTTVAAGNLAMVKGAIDRYIAYIAHPVANSTPLAQKAQQVSAANQAWFATLTPLSDFLGGKLGGTNLNGLSQNNLLQSVTQASGGVNFASATVTVTGDAVASSAQNAQSLVDVLKFLVSMLPGNDPKLATVAGAAAFSVIGTTAHLSLTLSEQQVEGLFMPATPNAKKAPADRGRLNRN
jgi:hypothetical protein